MTLIFTALICSTLAGAVYFTANAPRKQMQPVRVRTEKAKSRHL